MIVAAIVVAVCAAYVAAGAAIVGGCLATGWLPILVCATDVNYSIGSGFFGTWALWSLYIYTAATLGLVGLLFIKPDPDGLPAGWKFLGMFYNYETVTTVSSARKDTDVSFDGNRFAKAVGKAPSSLYSAMLETRAIRKETEKTNAEAERLHASVELSEAAIELEQLKARQKELQNIIDRNKKHE